MSEIVWVDNDTAAPVGSNPTPMGSNRPGALWGTNHALWVTLQGGAGTRQQASAANSYLNEHDTAVPTILSTATATNFAAGVPGSAGVIGDTLLLEVIILANATGVTLTLNSGFQNDTGAQDTTHYVLTGSTTVDTIYQLGWINSAGPLQMTASVANKVIVKTAPT